MGGMLIDEPKPIRILRNNIGMEHLAQHPHRRPRPSRFLLRHLRPGLLWLLRGRGLLLRRRRLHRLRLLFRRRRLPVMHGKDPRLQRRLHHFGRLLWRRHTVRRRLIPHAAGGGDFALAAAEGLRKDIFRRFFLRKVQLRLRHIVLPGRQSGGLLFQLRQLPAGLQRRDHAVVYRGEDLLLPGKLHLQLGGMDIDIHGGKIHLQVQVADGVAPRHQPALIGLLHRRRQQPGADIAPVDIKALLVPGGPVQLRRRDIARHPQLPEGAGQRQQPAGQIPSAAGINGGDHLAVAAGGKALPAFLDEAEGDLRPGNGDLGHQPLRIGPLRGVLFQKLRPGGHIEEQIPHHHRGAQGAAGLAIARFLSALQGDLDALLIKPGPCKQIHPGDRRDGRQRFAPEAQRGDGVQIALPAHLGGGVGQKRRAHILRQDAISVVCDPKIGHAAGAELYGDMLCSRVHGVFHQLLYHGAGPLHHLARRNAVGKLRRHLIDLRHGASSFPLVFVCCTDGHSASTACWCS